MWKLLTMFTSQVWKLCVLVLFIYGVAADWQILNESTDPATQDLSLQEDNLLPVPAPSLQSGLSRERSLTSHGQTGSKNASHVVVLASRLQPNQTAASAGTERVQSAVPAGTERVQSAVPAGTERVQSAVPAGTERVQSAVPAGTERVQSAVPAGTERVQSAVPAGTERVQSAVPAGTERVQSAVPAGLKLAAPIHSVSPSSSPDKTVDDVIDLAGEGLLLVDGRGGQPSQGQTPRDVAKMSREETRQAGSPAAVVSDDQTAESVTAQGSSPGSQVPTDDRQLAARSLTMACIEDSSWECQMFKQHFLDMQADMKLSPRASVYERSKRQASSNYNNVQVEASSWNSRNLLDCEDGDCFSGNGNDTDYQEVAPVFRFQSSTKTATNLTRETLTQDVKKTLAKELEDKLTTIFKNIPGFKCVDVDPRYVYIDSNGTLHFDNWEVSIDGGNARYTGQNGPQVAGLVNEAITNASEQYKNVTVGGQHPTDNFNVTKAVDEVEKEADNPCKMEPSPCCRGFGQCQQLQPNREKNNGIRLRCTDNCLNYDCHNHGQCHTDLAGHAYCSCMDSWIGPFCDKENKNTSNHDDTRSPVYSISDTSRIPTSLKIEDLSPKKRQELAQQLIDSLKITFGNFSGMKDIIVNPDNIRVEGGNLVIPWNLTFDSGNSAYTGKTPEEIADIVRNNLQSLGDSYKKNVTVDGQHPIDDLDFVGAAQQVEKQARDPCSSNSCQPGYSMCQASSATQIKCIHNCNSRPTECQHGGQCQLDSTGNAVCQCAGDYTGEDCQSSDSSLDAGQIAGVVVGSALIMGALAGAVCTMMVFARRRNKDVNFTEYSDEPSSDLASNPSNQLFMIKRPVFNIAPMSIYGQQPRPNFSTPSSYAASNNSAGANNPADAFNSRA